MSKNASECVCASTVVVFPHPFSPALLTSSAVRTPECMEEYHDGPEPTGEGDIQMEYSSN
jgi:hypothetical protein